MLKKNLLQESSYEFEVSVIITLHSEKILAYKTLRNIHEMVRKAQNKDIRCEILIGLDSADDQTSRVADEFIHRNLALKIKLYKFKVGDLAIHRNKLISNTSGKFVLIHDGDDFFTQNFIVNAVKQARSDDRLDKVYVPEILVNFDGMHYMSKFISSNSSLISKTFFFETNYYTSQYLIPAHLLKKYEYMPNKDGYGYEDWLLNTTLLAHNVEFVTVTDTAFFYRRKKTNSLLSQLNNNEVLLRKTPLFEPSKFLNLSMKPWMLQVHATNLPPVRTSIKQAVKRALKNHPRMQHYILSSWLVQRAALADIYSSAHTFRNPLRDEDLNDIGRIKSIIASNLEHVPSRMQKIGISKTLIEEWGKLNEFEPLLRASWDIFEYIPVIDYPIDSGLSRAYYDFCEKFSEIILTDIIFVPHMIRGGAELATILLTKSLCAAGRKVIVVTSLDSESVWADRIRSIEGAHFIENKVLLEHVPGESERLKFWMRVAQYWNIGSVTTINSEFGYNLLSKYALQLHDLKIRGYVHTYAFDITEDGYRFNYIPNGLVRLHGSVEKYVTDSKFYADELKVIHGFSDKEVKTLYLPVDLSKLTYKTDYDRKNRVLYAARICNQKIADIAVEVGKLLGEEGIRLDFYGNIDPEYADSNRFLKLIEALPTVRYMGSFDSFGSLPLNDYDAYLLTTRTEGLANVILEACMSNIYVVSAAVGGLPECIENNLNGYLIDQVDRFNPDAYAQAILDAYEHNYFAKQEIIKKTNEGIKERHSLNTYSIHVDQMYGRK